MMSQAPEPSVPSATAQNVSNADLRESMHGMLLQHLEDEGVDEALVESLRTQLHNNPCKRRRVLHSKASSHDESEFQ